MGPSGLGEEGKGGGTWWDLGVASLTHPVLRTSKVLVKVAAFGGLQPQAWSHRFPLSFPVVTNWFC